MPLTTHQMAKTPSRDGGFARLNSGRERIMILLFICGIAVAVGLWAQAAAPLKFEVASIRPSADERVQRRGNITNHAVQFFNVSLRELISRAYRMDDVRINYPPWAWKRFTLNATLPEGATVDAVPEMLRSLLEERFLLKVHRETRTGKVWLLEVAEGGAKLTPAQNGTVAPNDEVQIVRKLTDTDTVHVEIHNATMAALCLFLSRQLNRPVLDRTQTSGRYDFDFDTAVLIPVESGGGGSASAPPPPGPPPTDLRPGLKRMGLRLSAGQAGVEYLFIDSGQNTPIEQ